MSRRFRTAAGVILISNFHRPEDAESFAAFGRRVDVAIRRKRRGGHKEHPLFGDPSREFRINVFELLAHRVGVVIAIFLR